MKNILWTHVAFITAILIAGGIVWHKYNTMACSQNLSLALSSANAIIEKHNAERFELVKHYHEKFSLPKTAQNYSNSLFVRTICDSIMQNARLENMENAARLYDGLKDSIQRFVADPMFENILNGLKYNNCSDTLAWQTQCALLTHYCLIQMQWYPGSDIIDCRIPRTVLISDLLNPAVGDTVNFDAVFSFERAPFQYLEFTLNDQPLKISNHKAQITLNYQHPSVYPLKITGSVTSVDSDSIARFNKTFYLRVKP